MTHSKLWITETTVNAAVCCRLTRQEKKSFDETEGGNAVDMKQRYNKSRSVIQLIQMTYIDNVFVGMIRLVYQTAPRQQL